LHRSSLRLEGIASPLMRAFRSHRSLRDDRRHEKDQKRDYAAEISIVPQLSPCRTCLASPLEHQLVLSLAFVHRRCALCGFSPFAYVFGARRRVPILPYLMSRRPTRLPSPEPPRAGSANDGAAAAAAPIPHEVSEAKPRAERPWRGANGHPPRREIRRPSELKTWRCDPCSVDRA
jgi:hypothetical protein